MINFVIRPSGGFFLSSKKSLVGMILALPRISDLNQVKKDIQ